MMTKFFHKLVLSSVGITLGLGICSSSVKAATVTYDFIVDQPSQSTITGTLSYDDSSIFYYPAVSIFRFEPLDCYLYSSAGPLPPYCGSGGSYARLTDFSINVFGNTFTKSNAETFDLVWQIDVPRRVGDSYTGLANTASWNNPSLSLSFNYLIASPTLVSIGSTDINNNPVSISGSLSYTLRNINSTSVPEGRQELAILSLGLLGFISLLKKKVFLELIYKVKIKTRVES
jgi:hypothetical protein